MEKRIFNLIIVDESGSMEVIRKQAFEGINRTIDIVRKMQMERPNVEQRISLLTFDDSHRTFIYDNLPARSCTPLGWNQYAPYGGTPLYDAIGLGVSRVNSQIAEGDNVLVTIITDGYENASTEYTLRMVKNLISKLKKRDWTFTFIGTDNLDVEEMARSFDIDNHLEFRESPEETDAMFACERMARVNYNMCVSEGKAMPCGSYFKENKNAHSHKLKGKRI